LALVWGVTPLMNQSQPTTTDELIDPSLRAALATAVAERGSTVVITAGVPIGGSGRTNLIKVETL
jgi:pyruvate kinase